jgi:catechol 2,3-dioxygenase-like lactoylglutathione lyase family enzyme
MQTPVAPTDGSLLGIEGEITSDARFAYDRRGPRTSPAIEIQGWVDPPVTGEPYAQPNHVGLQSVGVAVDDLDATLAGISAYGAVVVGQVDDAGSLLGAARASLIRASDGVTFDLVESAGEPHSRLHHMRLTCADLDRSVAWYEAIGFAVLERVDELVAPASFFGLSADGAVAVARLRLPDEPFALVLHEWLVPRSFGEPYATANHRGMYRAAVCVDDTRAAADTLLAAGFTFDDAPRAVTMAGTPVPEMWLAFMRDPDGFPVELVERPRRAFR